MAKKKFTKTKQTKPSKGNNGTENEKVPVTKQTAGAVTGAVLGGVVAGPVGALAGGAVGAMVGDSSAKGKKPIKRAVDAIREEVTSGRVKEALKSVGEKIKSLRPSKKKKKTATTKKSAPESALAPKKKKAKSATRKGGAAKSVKAATMRPKKRAKKKS